MIPYTYLIGWTALNKFYYGVRYAKKCIPDELWKTYFSSSKVVKNMRTLHGEPNIIQVRKKFTSVTEARHWEHRVLKKLKVTKSDSWLNQTDNKSIAPMPGSRNAMFGKTGNLSHRYGAKLTEETKQQIGEKSKRKRGNMPAGFSEKMRDIVTGRKHSVETKNKIKEKLTGRVLSEEHKKNISKNHADLSGDKNPFFGKRHSEAAKAKMKQHRKNLKWVHNPATSKRKLVEFSLVESFLTQGWKLGKGNYCGT